MYLKGNIPVHIHINTSQLLQRVSECYMQSIFLIHQPFIPFALMQREFIFIKCLQFILKAFCFSTQNTHLVIH